MGRLDATTHFLHDHNIHRGFIRDTPDIQSINMQLTSIFSAALLPLLALAQDTTSGTTTSTLTSTLTKTVTLSKATVTMTMSSNSSSSGYATGTTGYTVKATGTASSTGSSSSTTAIPGVNELGSGAASLNSAHVAVAGFAGMLVVALM